MIFKFFKDKDERHYSLARKRLRRQTPNATLLWADSGVWAVNQALDEYRQHSYPAALEQARMGIIGVLAAVDDLLDKTP